MRTTGFSEGEAMDKLELLLTEAAALCGQKRCCHCEFFGRNNPRAGTKKCQALLFAKYLREHGVEVKGDA